MFKCNPCISLIVARYQSIIPVGQVNDPCSICSPSGLSKNFPVRDDAMSNTPSRDGAMFIITEVPCAVSGIYELTLERPKLARNSQLLLWSCNLWPISKK